ncbi:DUF4230 domain-containing protein [Corallococcus praedator]|uniref:DUF4230 domain-containing protein n=1 Tax=Corallococcus praedator TaxID=2316724 RepID=A0ABX9QFH9_9BACT|nr:MULTISPECIES: DUF4230 domain-containing protein [Corallococcus]RKH19672.1 DUF4230 domain-containing protein [Corallococcus sp. CA047B]RKH26314.1 DUF4230 domain-containing protein [Corallococcus sp. CA031C]RKI06127.1 DUF4230 domain-containing protein [Corallococcus praedator]
MANLSRVLSVLAAAALGALVAWLLLRPASFRQPDPAVVVEQMREVARLETLDVALYKKVTFAPEPEATDALWKDVLLWASYTLKNPHGRAIVFADAHLGFDFQRFDASHLRATGTRVDVLLPPMVVTVALRPGETEIIDSNLDSAQTAQLLEKARLAFEREVRQDARLKDKARQSAERSLRGLLLTLGFREVHFVERLPLGTAG